MARGASMEQPVGVVVGVRKIAVLRANALGDFIFALPALDALRAAYPDTEIVLLARQWHADFLRGRPGAVSRVVALPAGVLDDAGGTVPEPEGAEALFAALRAERFDLALQLHGGGRHSNPVLLRLAARLTAGLRTADAPLLDRWVPYMYYQHEVLRLLEVVALVGARPVMLAPRLAVTAADVWEASAAVDGLDRPFVVLHPGAGDPRRRWPAENFAAVGDALAGAGARVAVTGDAAEGGLVAAVAGAMRSPVLNLAGRLSLGGLAGLLSRAGVVVANDTGPLHVAAAVGAATAGIYWCGNLINAGPLTRARQRPAISWRLACPVCGVDCTRASCEHRPSFVADVPVAEVLENALDLWRRGAGA